MIETILNKTINSKSNDKFLVLESLIKKHYTPIANQRRLLNGSFPYEAVLRDLNKFYSYLPRNERTPYASYFAYIEENIRSWNDKIGVFFVTRQDIPAAYQLVQTAHAAACMSQRTKYDMHKCNFIIFGTSTKEDLTNRYFKLAERDRGDIFHEPDNDTGYTSFATKPIRYSRARRIRALEGCTLLTL